MRERVEHSACQSALAVGHSVAFAERGVGQPAQPSPLSPEARVAAGSSAPRFPCLGRPMHGKAWCRVIFAIMVRPSGSLGGVRPGTAGSSSPAGALLAAGVSHVRLAAAGLSGRRTTEQERGACRLAAVGAGREAGPELAARAAGLQRPDTGFSLRG